MGGVTSNKDRLRQLGWGKADVTPGKRIRLNTTTELTLRQKIHKLERAMVKIATVLEVKADMYKNRGNEKASDMLLEWAGHLREALE